MRQAGHQDPREDEWGCREPEKSTPSRRSEENAVFDDTPGTGNFSRVVLVIAALALVFIAIMTYFVAQMQQKP